MKKIISFLLALAFLNTVVCRNLDRFIIEAKASEIVSLEKVYCQATLEDEFADDTVILVLQQSEEIIFKDYTAADFFCVGCVRVEDLTSGRTQRVRKFESGIDGNYNRILKLKLSAKSKQGVLDAIDVLIEREDVLQASPDYVLEKQDVAESDSLNIDGMSRVITDPDQGLVNATQWGLSAINLINEEAEIDCEYFATGSKEIRVGVIDDGIDSEHPALKENIDLYTLPDGFSYPSGNAYEPRGFHGTHVAGIIGAKGSQARGVCLNVELVSLKYGTADNGSTYISYIGELINDANTGEHYIPILNISSYYACSELSEEAKGILEGAIVAYTGLIVCCAGNDMKDIDQNCVYPACFDNPDSDNVISVGAIGPGGEISEWDYETDGNVKDNVGKGSNYGENHVDIYAPGTQIYSTMPNGEYGAVDGSSQAAPFVTGVAALLMSIDPDLSAQELKNAILNSADTITIHAGEDEELQTVRKLNAFNAIKYVFDSYNAIELDGGERVYRRFFDVNSSFYIRRNTMCKLVVDSSLDYNFIVQSSIPMQVTLFNEELEKMLALTSEDFTTRLTQGTYYLEIKPIETSTRALQEVVLRVLNPQHAHNYDYEYSLYSDTKHKAFCACGEYRFEPHVVVSGGALLAKPCLLCGQLVDTGFGQIIKPNSIGGMTTVNGSYIMHNGIIVLDERDIEAYFNGTLVFFKQGEDLVGV